MNLTEKKLGGKTVYDGKISKLEVDEVELPDGSRSLREVIRHSGGAAVYLEADGKILLVRQFRYAYGKEIYEIPAGKLNKGEDPRAAALRELEEETGYKAELSPMFSLYPTPGYTDEVIYVYKAENPRFVGSRPDEGEFLNCKFLPKESVLKMIKSGEISDAKTISAVYAALSENKG